MAIVDNVKDIYTLVKKLGNQELLEKMADLRDEIFELREENRNLKEKLAEKNNYEMNFKHNMKIRKLSVCSYKMDRIIVLYVVNMF